MRHTSGMGLGKHFRRMIGALALAIAAIALDTPAHADTWHRADTRSFIIYSDGDSRSLEQFAHKIEMFDALFMYYFGLEAPPPPAPAPRPRQTPPQRVAGGFPR